MIAMSHFSPLSPVPHRYSQGGPDGYLYNPDSVTPSPDGRYAVVSSDSASFIIDTQDPSPSLNKVADQGFRTAGFIAGGKFCVLECVNDTILMLELTDEGCAHVLESPGWGLVVPQCSELPRCGFSHKGEAYLLSYDAHENLLHRSFLRKSRYESTLWLWDQGLRPSGYIRQDGDNVNLALLPTADTGRNSIFTHVLPNTELGISCVPVSLHRNAGTKRLEMFIVSHNSQTHEHSLIRLCCPLKPGTGDIVEEPIMVAPRGRIMNVVLGPTHAPLAVDWWDGVTSECTVIPGSPCPKSFPLNLLTDGKPQVGDRVLHRVVGGFQMVEQVETIFDPGSVTLRHLAEGTAVRLPSPADPASDLEDYAVSDPYTFETGDGLPLSFTLASRYPQAVKYSAKKRKDAQPAVVFLPASQMDNVLVGGYSPVLSQMLALGFTVVLPHIRGLFQEHENGDDPVAILCDVLDTAALGVHYKTIRNCAIVAGYGIELSNVVKCVNIAGKKSHRLTSVLSMYPVIDYTRNQDGFKQLNAHTIVVPDVVSAENKILADTMVESVPSAVRKRLDVVTVGNDYVTRAESAVSRFIENLKKSAL